MFWDIIPYSDIQSQLLCFFFIISLQLNVKISVLVKYRKSIEIVSKSTRYRYRIFRRYRYFKIDPIPDTSSTRYRFRPNPNFNIIKRILCITSLFRFKIFNFGNSGSEGAKYSEKEMVLMHFFWIFTSGSKYDLRELPHISTQYIRYGKTNE